MAPRYPRGKPWSEQVDEEDPDTAPTSPVFDESTRQYRFNHEWHEDLEVERNQSRNRLDLDHGFMRRIVRTLCLRSGL